MPANDRADRVQQQILENVKRSQDAIVEAVRRFSQTTGGRLPDLPDLPLSERLPDAGEVVETYFAFRQELLASQRDFAARLIDAARTGSKARDAKKSGGARRSAKKTGAKKS
jgi:hypothetical protein